MEDGGAVRSRGVRVLLCLGDQLKLILRVGAALVTGEEVNWRCEKKMDRGVPCRKV